MMMMLMMPMNWGIWRHCDNHFEKRSGGGDEVEGVGCQSLVRYRIRPPSPITDLRRSGVTGSGECGGGGGSFGPRSIRQRRKKKEKSINQSMQWIRQRKLHTCSALTRKEKKRPFESGTKIGYKNRVQKSGTKI